MRKDRRLKYLDVQRIKPTRAFPLLQSALEPIFQSLFGRHSTHLPLGSRKTLKNLSF